MKILYDGHLKQYELRKNVFKNVLNKKVLARGVLAKRIQKRNENIFLFVSIEVFVQGKWYELDHLNVKTKKDVPEPLELFKTYQFKGTVYRYYQPTKIIVNDEKMQVSSKTYSLKGIESIEKIEPREEKDLTAYQEKMLVDYI